MYGTNKYAWDRDSMAKVDKEDDPKLKAPFLFPPFQNRWLNFILTRVDRFRNVPLSSLLFWKQLSDQNMYKSDAAEAKEDVSAEQWNAGK